MGLRTPCLEGFLEVHHRRHDLILDLDQVRPVGRFIASLGQHHCYRLALENCFLLSDREPVGHCLFLGHEGGRHRRIALDHLGEVLVRVDSHYAMRLGCGSEVNALDASMSVRTAHDGEMQSAGPREIVEETALAANEPRVFAPVDPGSDHGRDRHGSAPPCRGGMLSRLCLRAAHRLGGRLHGLDDVHVARTPAEVAFEASSDLVL